MAYWVARSAERQLEEKKPHIIEEKSRDAIRLLKILEPNKELWKEHHKTTLDVPVNELKMGTFVGLQGSGKTTISLAIAYQLVKKYGGDILLIRGPCMSREDWVALCEELMNRRGNVLAVVWDDALTGSRRLGKVEVFFWASLRHFAYRYKTIYLFFTAQRFQSLPAEAKNSYFIVFLSTLPNPYDRREIRMWIGNTFLTLLDEISRNKMENHRQDWRGIVYYYDSSIEIIKFDRIVEEFRKSKKRYWVVPEEYRLTEVLKRNVKAEPQPGESNEFEDEWGEEGEENQLS